MEHPSQAPPDTYRGLSEPLSPLRLKRLLESNDVPLDADIPVIRGIVLHKQARIRVLNSQLDALQATMERILRERDEITDSVRKHAAVVSPVRRVPSELISKILALTPCTRHVNGLAVTCPPWRLGHICSSWRSAALSSPFLWSSIEIIWCIDSHLADIYPLSMIETQLLLSGKVPLEVYIDSVHYEDSLAESALIDLLILHCHRWASFCACISGSPRVLEDVYGRVPQLKRFQFISHEETTDCIAVSVAPSVREIILTNSKFRGISPRFLVPWNQITRYCGVYSPLDQMNILEGASNLEECGLGFTGDLDNVQAGRMVVLPHLRRLYVADADLLDHLTAPSLGVLFLEGSLDPLSPFLQRSYCQLTKLVLGDCQFHGQLVSTLRLLSKLEYLAVNHPERLARDELTDLWASMSVSGSSSNLCPSLTFLALGYAYSDEYFSEAFFIMIRSRIHPTLPSRLSFLRILLDSRFLPDRRLNPFTSFLDEIEGLDVAFQYTDDEEGTASAERERILFGELTIGTRSLCMDAQVRSQRE
ncbi:hypothetical protein B0H11DRAFT_2107177 [Mycena galericulata]|nr:hypothetical protein B0H11DRAFT_2107177 [Mycena galericulata]